MRTTTKIMAATLAMLVATPALADDAGIDSSDMMEQVKPQAIDAITPAVDGFSIQSLNGGSINDFMATAPVMFEQGYRLSAAEDQYANQESAGIIALFVPEEFAFRSNEQDTGVDASLPGRFLSSSTRSDFLSQNGPANRDKSSLGVRFGF